MYTPRSQRGMTFWGLSFVLSVLAFFVLVLFKLLPPFIEDYKVRSIVDSMARQPDFATMTHADIATALSRRFDIDMITTVDPAKHLFIENRGRGARVVRIQYEVVTPMVYNVSLLIDFKYETKTSGGSE